MRKLRQVTKTACVGLILLAVTGCQSAAGARMLSFVGLSKRPIVFGITAEHRGLDESSPLDLLMPFKAYEPLFAAMQKELGRPVSPELCFPFQLAPSLDSGLYHFAIVSPTEYAHLPDPARYRVLVVSVDAEGRAARPALLIVRKGSPIRSIDQLRGHRVAFGPVDDARTHHAAVALLAEHDVEPADLDLTGLPGSGLRHSGSDRATAQRVLRGSAAAGFVDQEAWERWPETEEKPNRPSRDRFRVLGRTEAVPQRMIVVSPQADAQTVGRVGVFLLSAQQREMELLSALQYGGFTEPTEALLERCRAMASQ